MLKAKGAARRGDLSYLTCLAVLTAVLTYVLRPTGPSGPDINSYLPIARQILDVPGYWWSEGAFETNFWSVGYPTLLAAMLDLLGSLERVVVLQSVLAGSLVFVPWLLTRHLPGPARLIAPAVLAATPAVWVFGASIGYEVFLSATLGFTLAIAWNLLINPTASALRARALAAACGLLMAASVLLQSKTLVVLPVIVWLLLKAGRPQAVAAGLAFAAGLLPWALRNLIVLGIPTPLAGNGAFNLWVGNNPVTQNGGSMEVPPSPPPGLTDTQAAFEYIVNQPERTMELLWLKTARLLQPAFAYPEVLAPGPGRTALHLLSGILALAVAVGVVAFLGARAIGGSTAVPRLTPPAIFVLLFFLVHLPFIAEPRYMPPVLPVSVSVATVAWLAWVQRVRTRGRTKHEVAEEDGVVVH